MQRERGFSMIELLIVMAILLILAGLAIPNLVRARIAANEASAVATMRVVNLSQRTYDINYTVGFADSLTKLGPPPGNSPPDVNHADLIDKIVMTGQKSGYSFTLQGGAPVNGLVTTYQFWGDPQVPRLTGITHYFTDESAVIRYNMTVPAGPNDPPIPR